MFVSFVVPLVVLALIWIFLGKFLKDYYSFSAFLDSTHLIHPLFTHISKSFAVGEFPYWIDSILGGIPLYNTPQFSLLYPFYFFGWNLYRDPIVTSLHLHYVTVFHVGILWLNTY